MMRKGFVLILALFVVSILFMAGLAFLGQRSGQYRQVRDAARSEMARAVAEAGMEDVFMKLSKDPNFPPAGGPDQLVFTYSELLKDPTGVDVGSYSVTVDVSYRVLPYYLVKVTSVGSLGEVDSPTSSRTIRGELDLSPTLRSDGVTANPNYFRWVNWVDEGAL